MSHLRAFLLALGHGLVLLGSSNLHAQPAADRPFSIVASPERVDGVGWRIQWESETGRTYLLQRWNGEQISRSGQPPWLDVERVTAEGALAFAEDRDVAEARFYRVVLMPPGWVGDVIQIVGVLQRDAEGWQVSWTSVPGVIYALERWTGEDLGVQGNPLWTEVTRVSAVGNMTSARDPVLLQAGQRFYRVVQVGELPISPQVSAIVATETTLAGGPAVRLVVTVSGERAIQSVSYLDGEVELGEASFNGSGWELIVPVDAAAAIKPYFIARAVNALGQAGYSPVLRYGLIEVNRFAVVDANGRPTGEYVEAGPDGLLPPFEFRPTGRSIMGAQRELSIRFPAGARLVVEDGREYVEFEEVEASFGAESSMQFVAVGAELNAFGLEAGRSLRPMGQHHGVKRIPLGPLAMEVLADALGYDPDVGIPVIFFDKFRMLWRGGTLVDYGIRDPQFQFLDEETPLPSISGGYRDYHMNLLRDRNVRLPFAGRFEIQDESGRPSEVNVPFQQPVWVTLTPEGQMRIRGQAQVQMPGGGYFRGAFGFDDPFYQFHMLAESVHLPLLGSLSDLLPPDPQVCVPALAGPDQLLAATDCLRSYARAYANFSASALAVTPAADGNAAPASPPEEFDTVTSLVEAWLYTAITPGLQSVPLDQIRTLLRLVGQSASGSRDVTAVLRYQVAMLRAKKALVDGVLQGSAEAMQDLEIALQEATAAALSRAREPDAMRNLDDMREASRMLVEIATTRQALELSNEELLTEVVPGLFQSFAARYLEELGVRPNQFSPELNPVIGEMNRFVVYEHLSKLVSIMADLARLGVETGVEGPLDEALSQLALRLYATASAGLNEAEAAEDLPGFSYAVADLLDLLAMRDLALFPEHPVLNVIPPSGQAGVDLADRMNALLELDLAKPRNERSFVNMADEIRRLLKILREVPPTVTFTAPPIKRVHDFMEAALSGSLGFLPGIGEQSELLELLEGGTLHARLARQFQFVSTRSWEGERLPMVVARLATVAREQRGWSALERAARLLIEEADRLREDSGLSDGERSSLRLVYVQQAALLLTVAREVAVAIWQSEASRRAQDPLLFLTDLVLPGDILVDRVAGSAWYDRSTRKFGGSFRGQVRLPKFNGVLRVLKSSFDSGGRFDLSCYGTLTVPGGQVTISPRFPLRISYESPEELGIAGSVRVALDNGIHFGGHLILEDPFYGFGLEAGGLRLELADELVVLRPTLDGNAVAAFEAGVRRALVAYQESLSATLESLVSTATDLPVVDETALGDIPEFDAPQLTMPFEALNAWANGILLEVERGGSASYRATAVPVREHLRWLNSQAVEARDALGSEIRVLENQLQRVMVRRRVAEAARAGKGTVLTDDDHAAWLEEAEKGAKDEVLLHAELLRPEVMRDLGETLKHVRVLLQLAQTQQVLGVDMDGLEGPGVPDDPSVPESGPCREVYGATSNPLMQAALMMECAQLNYFPGLGLDPESGGLKNEAVLKALPEYELDKTLWILVRIYGESQSLGVEKNAFAEAIKVLNRRWHALLIEHYDRAAPEQRIRRLELVRLMRQAEVIAGAFDDSSVAATASASRALVVVKGMSSGELSDLDRAVREGLKKRKERQRREVARDLQWETRTDLGRLMASVQSKGLLQDLGIFLTVMFEQTGERDQVYLEKVNSYVRYKVKRLLDRSIDPNYLNERLHEGLEAATALSELTAWAVAHMPDDVAFSSDLRLALQNITVRFHSVAEARRAWWLISRYAELLNNALEQYGDQMGTALREAYRSASTETLLAAGRISDSLATLLNQVELESVVFQLPGDLLVRQVFGSFLYRRDTAVLAGRFGGRLEFPRLQTFFEIEHAALATDGSFSIAARSGGPLAFGSGVTVEAAIAAKGGPDGLLSVSGMGEMRVGSSDGSVQTYVVSVGYNGVTGLLSFDSVVRDINLRFTDDFLLYSAGLGFEVSTVQPAGRLVLSGSAGLVAKLKPLPAQVGPELFQLNILDTAVSVDLDEAGFTLALERGMILLPELFQTEICPTNVGGILRPPAMLTPNQPLFITYTSEPEAISFGGQILLHDLGFEVPGIPGLKVAVCSANLTFRDNQQPFFSDLTASVQIPLPNQMLILDVSNVGWNFDGFPTGTIQLRNNLVLFESGGFRLDTLGTADGLCPQGTALTLAKAEGQPVFRLDGGLRFTVPADVLAEDGGGELFTAFCAGLDFGVDLEPRLELNALEIGGSGLRLGGPGGLLITNARLRAERIENLFHHAPDRPFLLTLSGGFEIPGGPGFALLDARFTFQGEAYPRFSLGGASLASGESLQDLTGLPIQVTAAGILFLNPDLPIDQLFHPENMIISLSASLALPPEAPVLTGRVENLVVTVVNGVPQVSLSGIGLGIEDFEVPPLSLSGQLYIGGLGPGEDIYFAGILGGTLQGAGVKALAAFNLYGAMGICFSVNAGPAGIPLGPTGFLFTGAEGGVSFLNTNADPCEFRNYINVGPDGVPVDNRQTSLSVVQPLSTQGAGTRIGERHVMTWEELRLMQERHRIYEQASASGVNLADAYPRQREITLMSDGAEFPCPTGDCPPATINILCQAHPDLEQYGDRVIVKFSSLDESFLNGIGITPEFVASLGLTTAEAIAADVASRLVSAINALTPRPDPAFVGPNGEPIGAELNLLLDQLMAGIEAGFQAAIQVGVQAALGNNESVYQAILAAAYAGVRCPDATVKLTGTFSHAAVSSFLSGTGGGVLSTTGSAGLVGTVNLFGIPVGFLDGFVNATDSNGDPNPSMCGMVRFALGPLELGQLKMLNQCEGCVTGVLASFGGLAECLADGIFDIILPKVAPQLVGVGKFNALQLMTDEEKLAFLAEWFSLPPTPGSAECFAQLLANALDSINPEFTMCGAVQPKLFGFPLAGRAIEVAAAADKTSMAGQFGVSSSYLLGPYGVFFPVEAMARFGFGVAWPNPDDLILGALRGRFNSPEAVAAYLEEGFAHVLANATYTVGMELSAFGMKGFRSGARVLMPNLTNHPEVSGWQAPENRNLNLPSRLELMIAAVENGVLDNPLWKGTAEDIHLAFRAEDPRRTRVAGLSFAEDYFPHGGIIGAAHMGLPRAIIEAPPESLLTLLNPETELITRLGAGLSYIQDYVLTQTEVGTLGFYVPAPNPPLFTDAQGNPLGPRQLLDSIMRFDPALGISTEFYPLHAAFLQGYIDGQLLGIPIARAQVLGTPPTATEEGRFLIATEIPEGSWMQSFVESASMTFEVRQAPPLTIEEQFGFVEESLRQLLASNSSPAQQAAFLDGLLMELQSNLPKVSLDLAVNQLRVPEELGSILKLDGSTTARFVAYAPQFDPQATGDNPMALVQRQGGMALQARLRFADLVTIDNAELAVFPGRLSLLTGLPAMAGLFDVPLMPVGLGVSLRDVHFAFHSEPAIGAAYLDASGSLDPLQVGPWLRVTPLNGSSPLLAGELRVTRTAGVVPATELRILPAQIEMPIFGPDLRVLVHGATPAQPFTFSTDGEWEATVRLEGGLMLRDVLGTPVVQLGSTGGNFAAALSGRGLESATLTLDLPGGLAMTAFPGQPFAQTLLLGAAGEQPARLVISSDGTFQLHGRLEGSLDLSDLSVGQVDAGADLFLSDELLRFFGTVSGGTLDDFNTGSATASLTITKQGVITLAAEVSVPPLQLGRFRISGLDGGNLAAALDHEALRVASGAQLSIQGVAAEVLTLDAFAVLTNGDFVAQVATGRLVVPDHFILGEGSAALSRAGGITTFEMTTPRMTLFPGADFGGQLPGLLERVIVESTGRFYYDSGQQVISLPGTFSASGRLEFGYEPDANAPQLSLTTAPVQFGEVVSGQSTTRTLRLSNVGGSQLVISASAAATPVFTVTPNVVTVAPGGFADLTLRFSPNQGGTATGLLTLVHNSVTSPTAVALSGQGRVVPVYHQSQDTVDFGEQPVGGGSIRQLLISNLGLAPLVLESITVSGPFMTSTTPVAIAPGDTHRLFVTFRPDTVGAFAGTLRVQANDGMGTHEVQLLGAGSQLRWYTQRDVGSTLRSIAMRNESIGIAVGDNGTLLTTVNAAPGGIGWTPMPVAGGIALHDVALYRGFQFQAWAVGASGLALTTTDANLMEWRPIVSPTVAFGGNQWRGVSPWQPGRAMIVGQKGGNQSVIARQIDDQTFQEILPGSTAMLNAVSCLFEINSTILNSGVMALVVGNNGTIFRTGNNGVDWGPIALPAGVPSNIQLNHVVLHESGLAFIVGDGGTLLRSEDFGIAWVRLAPAAVQSSHLYRVRTDGTRVWVVGQLGLVLASDDAGLTWRSEGTAAGNRNLLGIDMVGEQVWTAGNNGHIQHRPTLPPAGPLLTFSTGFLDFGTVPLGTAKRQVLTLHNRGTDRLEISGIIATGPGISVSEGSLGIDPGQSRNLTILSHATEITSFDPPPGQPNGIIRFESNDPAGDKTVSLRARTRNSAWVQKAGLQNLNLTAVRFPTAQVGYALHAAGLAKSIDGGESWAPVTLPSLPGPLHAIHFSSSTAGWVGGGNPGAPFILRTANGGGTWSSATIPGNIRGAITGISFPPGNSTIGYAITDRYTSGQINEPALVLRTASGGASWADTISAPGQFAAGSAIHAYSTSGVYVASGGALFQTTDSGASWQMPFNLGGAYPIRAIHLPGTQRGFVGGFQALFRRSEQAGSASPAWSAPAVFTRGQIVSIHFINESTGWCVANGVGAGFAGSFIFRTDDAGLTWREDYATDSLRLESVHGLGTGGNSAYAVGFNGVLLKYEPFAQAAVGVPSLPSQANFGTLEPEENASQTLVLRNVGAASFQVERVVVNNLGATEPFAVAEMAPTLVAPGGALSIPVQFQSSALGLHRAELIVTTDGDAGVVTSGLSAVVQAAPRIAIFDTVPTGLRVIIDGVTRTTPVAFTIGENGDAAQWAPGSTHTIGAILEQTRDGLDYLFQAWDPAAEREWDLVVPLADARYVAQFVPAPRELVQNVSIARLGRSDIAPANTVPNDVPVGPWLRLSNGQVTVPSIGRLGLQGAMFLSAQRMQAALQNGALRIPQDNAQPGLMEVSAGSWLLDFQAGSHLRLRAANPGVKLMDTPAVPPSQFDFRFAGNGDFQASFATLDDLPLVPGIVEFGPSSVTLSRSTFVSLAINGQARLFRHPDGGWAVVQPLNFQASEGPFTYTVNNLPTTLLGLGFVSLGADASSSMYIQRSSSGVFSVGASNLRLDLFGRTFAAVSATANSAGALTLNAAPSTPTTAPFVMGPFRLHTTQNSQVWWNVRNGRLQVDFSPSLLKAPGVQGWPTEGVSFPGFQIDSAGDFNHRILLPSFSFDGIALGGGGSNPDLNHLRLRRQQGLVSMSIRHQQSFFGNANHLSLDTNTAGQTSGSFYGSFLGAGISMGYDSTKAPYQFETRAAIGGLGYSLYFGAGGARYCQLLCGLNQPLADCTELFCFP